jgi:hypothetical protein
MQAFLHQIASGLAAGGIYASLAIALVLIYRCTSSVNFAQGELAMFSTYELGVGSGGRIMVGGLRRCGRGFLPARAGAGAGHLPAPAAQAGALGRGGQHRAAHHLEQPGRLAVRA